MEPSLIAAVHFLLAEVGFSFVIGMKLKRILLKSNFDLALFVVWKERQCSSLIVVVSSINWMFFVVFCHF